MPPSIRRMDGRLQDNTDAQCNNTQQIQVHNVFLHAICVYIRCIGYHLRKVSKGAKIRNRYDQVPHLTQDTNGKVTNSQLDTTNESQEVSPFPAGDHKAHIYKTDAHKDIANTRQNKNIKDPQKIPPWNVSKIFY